MFRAGQRELAGVYWHDRTQARKINALARLPGAGLARTDYWPGPFRSLSTFAVVILCNKVCHLSGQAREARCGPWRERN